MPAIHIGFMAGPFYEQGFRTLRTQDRCLLFTGTSKKHGISSTDKMTCRLMIRAAGQTRFFFQTSLLRRRTAACKSAAEPPLQKAWHFPLQNKFLPGLANIRSRGDKSFRIRVQRVFKQRFPRRLFNDFTRVHDHYLIAHERNDLQIMRNKQIG